jgi:hypothetical protein
LLATDQLLQLQRHRYICSSANQQAVPLVLPWFMLPVAERRLPQDHQLGFSQDRSILRTEKVRVQEAVTAALAAPAQLQQQQQAGGCPDGIHWTWCWVVQRR